MVRILIWFICKIFKLSGWKTIGNAHYHIPKTVLLCAPHTSNWDAFYSMAALSIEKVSTRFVIKREAMIFPLGYFLKSLGAIPVGRKKKHNTSSNTLYMMTRMFAKQASLIIAIAPEGTRSYAKKWKTGFYCLATRAKVPIILGYLDYTKKQVAFGPVFYPTGDIDRDIRCIQAFYEDKTGKYPEQGVR